MMTDPEKFTRALKKNKYASVMGGLLGTTHEPVIEFAYVPS
jgi:hypothetical protein